MFRFALVAFVFCTAAAQAAPGVLTPNLPNARENDPTVTVTVTRQNGSTGVVTVDYATQSGSAVAGREFVPVSGTLTFQDGEKTRSVTITLIDNATYDGNREFYLILSNPTGGATIASYPPRASIDVYDDELPPNVSIDDIRVTEGNSGTTNAEFTISITGVTRSIDIRILWYTNSYSASEGSDFQSSGATFFFTPADTQRTITVPIYGDLEIEEDERFNVYIYGGATFTKQYGYCTIVNDDSLLSILLHDLSVIEGNAGRTYAVLTLTATQPLSGVSIDYSTVDGTAVAGSDFEAVSGTVTFAGEMLKQIAIPILGDTDVEPDEQFTVHLSSSGAPVTLQWPDVRATIVNDDVDVVDVPIVMTLAQLSPSTGPVTGGTTVTLTGANLASHCTVAFGGTPAAKAVFANATSMTATTPAHAGGAVDVTATCGAETFTLRKAFTFTGGRRRAARK